MTEETCRHILGLADTANLDPFTIVQFVSRVAEVPLQGVSKEIAFKVSRDTRYSAEHIYDAMRCTEGHRR
jgi:hypothetical protein